MGGSTLEVTNLPPDINDADFHHLFSLSGCLGSRLERDGGGRCAPADDLTPNTAPRLQTSLSPATPIPFPPHARARRLNIPTLRPAFSIDRPVGYLSFADEPAAMTARNYYNDTTSYRLEVMINQPNRGPPPNQAPVDEDRGGKRMRNDGGYDGGGFGYQAGPPGPGPGSMPPRGGGGGGGASGDPRQLRRRPDARRPAPPLPMGGPPPPMGHGPGGGYGPGPRGGPGGPPGSGMMGPGGPGDDGAAPADAGAAAADARRSDGPSPRRAASPRLPDNASPTLHISGVPKDATVREICHIFRPFDGFQSARLVPSKDPERGPLCFAEFTNPELAFVALETLEGYLIDRDDPDSSALHIAFAKNKPSGRMARK